MTIHPVGSSEELLLKSCARKKSLQNRYTELCRESDEVYREVSGLYQATSLAKNDLFTAEGLRTSFISHYETAFKLAKIGYDHLTQSSSHGESLEIEPYSQLTPESWEPRKPSVQELDQLGFVSKIEELSEEPENERDKLDLSEEGFEKRIRNRNEYISSLKDKRQECIDNLAQIRFSAKDIRDKIRIYTPEKDRLVAFVRKHSQICSPFPPSFDTAKILSAFSPNVKSSSVQNKPSWMDSIRNLINEICAFIKKCFRFLFSRSM